MTTHDRYGFPIKSCARCGGTGHYAYSSMAGTVCFGCGGTGWQIAGRRAAAAHKEFMDAQRRARQPVAIDLQPGDRVTRDCGMMACRPRKNAVWRIVERVVPDTPGAVIVHYTDGTEHRVDEHELYMRDTQIDPAPYVQKAMARQEKRRVGHA
mgnify:CR=1 FL=1|jgi:hypothetical protein